MSDVVNNGMMQGDTGYILKYGSYMLMVALASSACSIIGAFFSARVAIGLGRNLRNKVFTQIENYSLHEFDKLGTAFADYEDNERYRSGSDRACNDDALYDLCTDYVCRRHHYGSFT